MSVLLLGLPRETAEHLRRLKETGMIISVSDYISRAAANQGLVLPADKLRSVRHSERNEQICLFRSQLLDKAIQPYKKTRKVSAFLREALTLQLKEDDLAKE